MDDIDDIDEENRTHTCTDDVAPSRASRDQTGQHEAIAASGPQCPLHFAMQRLADSAVAQLVYYAHGECSPRPELLREVERWQRLHALVARGICPASRQATAADQDLASALALVPEGQFTALREMLARCAAFTQGAGCPLDAPSRVELFTDEHASR